MPRCLAQRSESLSVVVPTNSSTLSTPLGQTDRTTAAYVDGASIEEAKQRVSEFLTAKYADKFEHFPQNVAGDVAKAYQVINPSR